MEHSSGTTEFYSCQDKLEVLKEPRYKHKVLEWTFAIANFIVELGSMVLDQLSSQHNSLFLPICLGMSILALLISIVEVVYKVKRERVIWKWRGTMPWFYYPTENGFLPFGSLADIVGVGCGLGQCIVAITSYCLFLKTGNNQIKISVWATVFAFCQLCSKLIRDFRHHKGRGRDVSSINLSSSL